MKILVLIGTLWGLNSWSQDSHPCVNWGGEGPCPYLQETICGVADRDDVFSAGQEVGISISVPTSNGRETHQMIASKKRGKELLQILSVHGAKVCDHRSSSDAPFEVCYKKGEQDGHTDLIWCKETSPCDGPNCGGNGVSVNSGSI